MQLQEQSLTTNYHFKVGKWDVFIMLLFWPSPKLTFVSKLPTDVSLSKRSWLAQVQFVIFITERPFEPTSKPSTTAIAYIGSVLGWLGLTVK